MRLAIQAGSVADGSLEGTIAYCKAMEVGNIVMTPRTLPGRQQSDRIDGQALRAQVAAVKKAGLQTGAMQYRPPLSLVNDAATAATLETMRKNVAAVAEAGLETLAMFLGLPRSANPGDDEGQWSAYIGFYRELIAQADQLGLKIAAHYCGHPGRTVPAGSEAYQRLFEAVPSANNGLTFCIGNAWNSEGERMYDVLRAFGARTFLVHMRGTRIAWGEAPFWWDIPDGPDIRRVFQTLREIGYSGMVSSEHMPDMPGEHGRDASAAWAMGYMKAVLRYL
jgi:sugar phosphate isomerase/epimerase